MTCENTLMEYQDSKASRSSRMVRQNLTNMECVEGITRRKTKTEYIDTIPGWNAYMEYLTAIHNKVNTWMDYPDRMSR